MADRQTPPWLLRAAASRVQAALDQLNTRHRVCGECHQFKHYENREHWKLYEQLHELPRKLTEAAERLDNVDKPQPTGR